MARLTRRRCLGALGAGALLSPLLGSIGRTQAGEIPRRFVLVVEGNCIEPIALLSEAARLRVEADSTGSLDGKRWYSRR
jgi:hypothetical protein